MLSPTVARKLYTYLITSKFPGGWNDEGGASREVKLKDVAVTQLATIELPKYCSDIDITVSDAFLERRRSDLPASFFLGGDDWFPPEYGDAALGRFFVVVPELNFPIQVEYSKASGERFSGKRYNCYSEISVSYPSEHSYGLRYCADRFTFGERPTIDVQREYINGLQKRFDFPNEDTPGVIGGVWDRVQGDPGSSVIMTPESCGWFDGRLQAMIKELIDESPSEYYSIFMNVSVGGYCQHLGGERYNVREVACDLLGKIACENDFERYDVTYGEVGPCSWPQVSKAKRKVKEPAVTELGVITLENGTEGSVSLTTYENGYRFCVTMSEPEDLFNFFNSELFKQATWSCGEL